MQVMPEIKGSVPVIFDEEQFVGLGEEDAAALAVAKGRQESLVRRFFGLEAGSLCAPEKLYRVASRRWLRAMDRALRTVTDEAWSSARPMGPR